MRWVKTRPTGRPRCRLPEPTDRGDGQLGDGARVAACAWLCLQVPGLVDWREGWFEGRTAPGRTANVFCEEVRAAVARSKRRGRVAIVIADNRKHPHSRWFPRSAWHAH
jgi:hypothetical protein